MEKSCEPNDTGKPAMSEFVRLYHYKSLLESWCHLRDLLRSFSIDARPRLEILATAATEVHDKTIEDIVGAGYGIFNGAVCLAKVLPRWQACRTRQNRSEAINCQA